MPTATLHTKLNDAEVRRLVDQPSVRNVRDPRYPALMLRFRPDRSRASWLLVIHTGGKSPSRKLGNWPDLSVKAALELLPKKLAEMTADPSQNISVDGWERMADLLNWFNDRVQRDRGLSSKWKGTVRSLVDCQLLPRLGSLPMSQVNRDKLDERLVWPMQEVRSLAYTRQAFSVVKLAFKRAVKLKKLNLSPLSDVVFTDFSETPIRPKPCALRPNQLPEILARLSGEWGRLTAFCMLPLMMLCHGTRISETRLAKWSNITLGDDGEWFIPAADAKTRSEHRLPLTQPMQSLLKAYKTQQRLSGYAGAYLFPRGDGQPLSEKQGQDKVSSFADGEWSSHDLRKIARSMWADLGVDYLIGELLLNHALDDLDEAYIHTHAVALKREALNRWHRWLEAHGLNFFATETEPGRAETLNGSHATQSAPLSPVQASITKEEVRT